MYYKFRITAKGLDFINTSKVSRLSKGIIYLTKDELEKISPDSILNYKKLQEVI